MSCPANHMRPEVGLSMPVSILKSVDLPAPFGPMTEWIVPSFTVKLTRSTAQKPPKTLVNCSVLSSGSMGLLLSGWALGRMFTQPSLPHSAIEQTHDSLRHEQDDQQHDESEHQLPIF